MPDIFGREPEDYAVVRGYQEAGLWEQRQQALAARLPHANPTHNFRAMGQLPEIYARAEPNAQVIGYIVNSLQAMQTAVDEVLYLKYRLPDYMPMNLDMPEGADSYLVRILDRTGRGQFITNPGTDAPVAGVSQRTENQRLVLRGHRRALDHRGRSPLAAVRGGAGHPHDRGGGRRRDGPHGGGRPPGHGRGGRSAEGAGQFRHRRREGEPGDAGRLHRPSTI